MTTPIAPATVHLVGAGPGDPGLLTVRGRELLQRCDCVVYDYLVNPELLALAPADAARHFVGKRGGETSITQDDINRLLLDLAHRHRSVVRLKGGDPFLFGRGGEEAQALAGAGIPFTVVPGVTSGVAVPAYAGIPITHRAASSAVAFATGHQQPGKDAELDWAALARIETLVLYMGMHKLAEICAGLIGHGRSPDTPACVIQWGTYPHQRVAEGTLTTLPGIATAAGLGAPAITVIGEVVRYREKIRWFDQRPLSGKTVLVCRSRDQAGELARLLGEAGARVLEHPLARYEPPADWRELDGALAGAAQFAWVVFTSANAVRFTWRRLREMGGDARRFANCRLAAVGPATAEALSECGLAADLVPETYSGEALAAALLAVTPGASACGPVQLRVLLPQADNANPDLRRCLVATGVTVTAVTAYRAIALPLPPEVATTSIDAVPFASSATVERFAAGLGDTALRGLIARGCRFFAIGPQTAKTMVSTGIPCTAIAASATAADLAAAVISALAGER